MRYSTVFSVLVAAATAAPALALPISLWSRAADDESLYERSLADDFWARDPPRSLSDSEFEERDFDEDSLFERSFDDEDIFWTRDVMPRGPPRPLPPTPQPKPKPRPLPPRPLPKPPRSLDELEELLAREFEDELFARSMEIDELD
ncbi:hypothetical protein EVJ58_g10798 [Rhodofomes roseus]|uniref:Uncharacterized protein n=1 Tax=Rhodofomes roseus TaxID=34475 RepID=A0A4Y9XMK4_9APHY|nr:hypothetical protein EVJ58_g10798 [Rhodofomes roseus]